MISVIVPVYDVEPYLRQCLDSIINQTYKDLEILLIDDGSPDNCGRICDEYAQKDNRIRVFHTENRGLSAARNLGLKEAKGEYIGFVDSDDWIEPQMYERLLNRLLETNADICLCGRITEDSGNSRYLRLQDNSFTGTDIQKALLDGIISDAVWMKLYQQKVFHNILFPVGKDYEDIAVMHRIMEKAEKVTLLSEALYHYRIRKGSISQIHSAKNLIDYSDACLNRYFYFKESYPQIYSEKETDMLKLPAIGFSRTWRWWYGCKKEEKEKYKTKLEELKCFAKANFPLFGIRSWPYHLRITAFFIRTTHPIPLAFLFWMNQIYRRIRPNH